jgi:membrane-associated phospholipid phosphatase
METLIDGGIRLILILQGLGDWLVLPMKFFSDLGTETFCLIVLPLLLWCVDVALGIRVAVILITSEVLNYTAKLVFAAPRPYWVSSRVKGWWPETTFGIPSGHAQSSLCAWGITAAYLKRTWVWIAAALMVFLIGSSRLYLGSHFPHDVVVGWLIGALLVFAFQRLWDRARDFFLARPFWQQLLGAFAVSMMFLALGFSAATLRKGFEIPPLWISNALLASTKPLAPLDPAKIHALSGAFFGLAAGLAWIRKRGGYQTGGPVWKRAARYLVGLAGVLIVWKGLGAIFPRGDSFPLCLVRYGRYALLGAWLTGGAPWLFLQLKLSERAVEPVQRHLNR